MKFKPRDYQEKNIKEMLEGWKTHNVLMYVLFTGGGKTVTFTSIIQQRNEPTLVIAHRMELVTQMSCTLAKANIYHRIIASQSTVKECIKQHLELYGKSFYDPQAQTAASSVQTIDSWKGTLSDGDEYVQDLGDGTYLYFEPKTNGKWSKGIPVNDRPMGIKCGKQPPKDMRDDLKRFMATVKFWVGDEGHHYLKDNIWGRAIRLAPTRAQGLLVTATPLRADGKGLGSHSDGLADEIIKGPPPRELIKRGYLVDYRVIAPPVSDIDMSALKISKTTGDYTEKSSSEAVENSSLVGKKQIIGDVVNTYLKFAKGKLGLTFVPSLKVGELIVDQYRLGGVPAELVHGGLPTSTRTAIMRKFKNRELLQLVNVDVLGEGTDIPACEVASFVRITASYGLYVQQFGRVLRVPPGWDGKEKAIIFDHVGNVKRHGLPDANREWSLDAHEARDGSAPNEVMAIQTCSNEECFSDFEKYLKVCPFCETPVPVPERQEGEGPEFIDGDLHEMTEEELEALRGPMEWLDEPQPIEDAIEEYTKKLISNHCKPAHIRMNVGKFKTKYLEKLEKRDEHFGLLELLRDAMAWYAGHERHLRNLSDSEIFRKFFLTFNVNWLEAQGLEIEKMQTLYNHIIDETNKDD
jgi:DNA repair protein RadD